jgi:hypothetical protein
MESFTKLAESLRTLRPGDKVYYRDWRGGQGEGVFLRHINAGGQTIGCSHVNSLWGYNRYDAVVVKRDFSADEGRVFKPFLGDGDEVVSALMMIAQVMES